MTPDVGHLCAAWVNVYQLAKVEMLIFFREFLSRFEFDLVENQVCQRLDVVGGEELRASTSPEVSLYYIVEPTNAAWLVPTFVSCVIKKVVMVFLMM